MVPEGVPSSPFSNITAGTHAPLLGLLTSPDVDVILLLTGILLVYVECNLPGKIVPGAIGLLAILLALFGLGHLSVQPLALLVLGTGLGVLLLDLRRSDPGWPAAVGTIMMTVGLRFLILKPRVSVVTAALSAVVFSAVSLALARVALRARRNKALPHPVQAERAE